MDELWTALADNKVLVSPGAYVSRLSSLSHLRTQKLTRIFLNHATVLSLCSTPWNRGPRVRSGRILPTRLLYGFGEPTLPFVASLRSASGLPDLLLTSNGLSRSTSSSLLLFRRWRGSSRSFSKSSADLVGVDASSFPCLSHLSLHLTFGPLDCSGGFSIVRYISFLRCLSFPSHTVV